MLAGIAFSTADIVAGLMPTYWLFAIWLPVLGITALTLLNSLQTVVQLCVDPDIRGRVVALYMMILMGGTPVGAPVIGWIGQTFGARWTLIGGGTITLGSRPRGDCLAHAGRGHPSSAMCRCALRKLPHERLRRCAQTGTSS